MFLIWNATETNVIIIAACIPTLSKSGPSATAFIKSYFTGSRFSSNRYASQEIGENGTGRKSGFERQRSKRDDQSLELPIMTNIVVLKDTGSNEVIVGNGHWRTSKTDVHISGNEIRQTLNVDVEHGDRK